ncbi:cyclase/dehydrase [Polynucleobacter wuianus]|uniref:Cyclase/dehydrase n=1 Tax=Polynucleobacter wuianus TaxID=1743168 RepID=A0A191UE62_9BURK|nr:MULTISPECIES: SRPBCC family protein [Polynucleobacter]ANI99299.1 cyclase/dehydrase [Polynucleobacter wuianus]MBU3552105.1 cyclase/dehydrase [Polynucleobacter sp. MWH-Post4-6-1]
MKWILISILGLMSVQAFAQDSDNPFNVQINIKPANGRFHINANYTVPITPCNAYAFLTDYEASKNIAGVVDLKILSRSANKVRVSRVLEEDILFFHIELKTVVEYTEVPYRLLNFEQVSGDAKFYKGTWRVMPEKDKTMVKYDAVVELDSMVPMVVIEYFMKNNLHERLESMAQKAAQYKPPTVLACK